MILVNQLKSKNLRTFNQLRYKLGLNIYNAAFWKTKNRIVVFESDDWGSLRIQDNIKADKLRKLGVKIDECPYSLFDALESRTDIDRLADCLSTFTEKPKFTLNVNPANPDFDYLIRNDYEKYKFISSKFFYDKYGLGDVVSQIKQSVLENLLEVQHHGREHLNFNQYLYLLKKYEVFKNAAAMDVFAMSFRNLPFINLPYLATFNNIGVGWSSELEKDEVIKSGKDLHISLYKKPPTSFISPVYVWDIHLEKILAKYNFTSIQGLYRVKVSNRNSKLRHKKFNEYNQLQLVRNCAFEPATNEKIDWVSRCLGEIQLSFKYKRPAIVSTHRINYVSGRTIKNRDKNLNLLYLLIKEIVKKWPDVKFMTSSELEKHVRQN